MTIKGLAEVERNLTKFLFDTDKAVDEAVLSVAEDVRITAKELILEISAGDPILKADGTVHIRSKPGDAPNFETGALYESMKLSHLLGSKVAHVYSELPYAEWLEFGTEKMAARPFLSVAEEKQVKNMPLEITKAIQAQIKNIKI